MAGTPIRRERKVRLAKMIEAPNTMTLIVEQISAGGSLVSFCSQADVPFSKVREWIYSEDTRAQQYEAALKTRDKNHEDKVVDEIMAGLNVDVLDAFDPETGKMKKLSEIPVTLRRWIVGLEVNEVHDAEGNATGTVKKLKMADKVRVIEIAARKLGLLKDRVAIDAGPSLVDLITRSRSMPAGALPSGKQETA